MLMLLASMLPALHALEHFYMDSGIALEKTEASSGHLTASNLNCDLCDFQFSSSNAPQIFEYSFCAPEFINRYISFAEENTAFALLSYFSLRAPPAAIV